MKVPKVDQNKCEGCGNCEAICPEVFEIKDEDQVSHVIPGNYAGLEGCIDAAIENCPEDAITFEAE